MNSVLDVFKCKHYIESWADLFTNYIDFDTMKNLFWFKSEISQVKLKMSLTCTYWKVFLSCFAKISHLCLTYLQNYSNKNLALPSSPSYLDIFKSLLYKFKNTIKQIKFQIIFTIRILDIVLKLSNDELQSLTEWYLIHGAARKSEPFIDIKVFRFSRRTLHTTKMYPYTRSGSG